ncbi:MAG: cytochrome c biogenesis protein CcdA [Chloroflexi bacterium]|nr:MAG: cytochrome c biogenesis protein CcdA [Chloroflexota bacterium]
MQKIESNPSSKVSSRTWAALGIILGAVLILLVMLIATSGQVATAPAWSDNLLLMIPAAFFAGVLSFLSPCTLPLLPAYFAFSFQASRSNVVVMTIAFFFGLATTLVLFGASATALSYFLFRNQQILTVVGGCLIIIFGLMSLFGRGFTGVQFQNRPEATVIGSYVYGATFSLGWSACIGPILGSIMTLLATQGMGILQGTFLAFIYALGLGLPLIIVAAFFSRLGNGTRAWQFLRGRGWTFHIFGRDLYMHSTSAISGLLLILMGALLLSGRLTAITQVAANYTSTWLVTVEEQMRILLGLQ